MNRISTGRICTLAMIVAAIAATPATARVLRVDDDVLSSGDGSSWLTAYSDLQGALTAAAEEGSGVTEIRIAQGEYRPNQPAAGRSATFRLIDGVAIRGGYAGVGAPNPDARDIVSFETVLSGDLIGDDGPNFLNNEENSYHVVTSDGTVGPSGVLDGVTITAGNANATSGNDRFGGGLFAVNAGGPTVSNCVFSSNSAQLGGGLAANNGNSPVVTNCRFITNRGAQQGGGVFILNTSFEPPEPSITGCMFVGNTSDVEGGGMYLQGKGDVTNCVFSHNTVNDVNPNNRGGGMYIFNAIGVDIVNCSFSNNESRAGEGGGIRIVAGTVTIANCIVWDNEGGEIIGSPTVSFSDVDGGYDGTGNIDADPLFVRAPNPGFGGWGTADDDFGDLRLSPGSPCIDVGDNSAVPAGVATDLDGNVRIADDPDAPGTGAGPIVDMGAFERVVDPERQARDIAGAILAFTDSSLFSGPNSNAKAGRQNSLANRATEAAGFIAAGDIQSAIDVLTSLLQKIDGQPSPPDWMDPSAPATTLLAEQVGDLIALLQQMV